MAIIGSKDVYNILRKSLSIVDDRIMNHGEIAGYILYKMLEYENRCTRKELVDYTMMGLLHDIGAYKTETKNDFFQFETQYVWGHSIYGYLFLKYLSPLNDKAEIVLYHHLDYNRYSVINSQYLRIIEYLNLADKLDVFMRVSNRMDRDYFNKYRDVKFSGRSIDLFLKAEEEFGIMKKLKNGSYQNELTDLLSEQVFTESYKRKFLEMLVYIIDFRSEYTVIHTLATVTFATEIGRLMQLNSHDMKILYYGSLLHDIGKLAIPLEILEAPRRLTDDEMRTMKSHVIITKRILDGIINKEVLEIAVRHHEKLDGSGYPRGLSGSELTLPQRIVAVADILSALYGKRSYKEAYDNELIIKILREDAGHNKICKDVVECAINNFDKIILRFDVQREETIGTYMEIKDQYEIILEKFKKFY